MSHTRGAAARDDEAIVHREGRATARSRERRGKVEPPHGSVDLERRRPTVDGDVIDIDPAGGVAGRIEPGAQAVGAEQVLLELEPHEVQRRRRVVYVPDRHRGVDRLGSRVERRANRIVSPLLPVVRAGAAAGITKIRRGGAIIPLERVERVVRERVDERGFRTGPLHGLDGGCSPLREDRNDHERYARGLLGVRAPG